MDIIKIGILSDTHLGLANKSFIKQVAACFTDCEIIIHAGDLTNISILQAFAGKEVHAVHGNMCDASSYHNLPKTKIMQVAGFSIAITHGHIAGYNQDIEDFLIAEFNVPDCVIYGHTHKAVCHMAGPVLVVNPGSFCGSGRYGASGTYAILEVGKSLSGTIKQLTQP